MTDIAHRPLHRKTAGDVQAVYDASHTNRRATKADMEERAEFLIDYANEHGPVTVSGLYYQAEVVGIPASVRTISPMNFFSS